MRISGFPSLVSNIPRFNHIADAREKKRSNRKRCERTLRAEELAGDVKSLASHNDDLLAVEQLLGDGTGQATQKVPLAVDGDLFQRHSVSGLSFSSSRSDCRDSRLKI